MHSLLTTLLFCSIFGNFATLAEHPIYLTFAEIDYKEERSALEISIKIFADDLEKVLSAQEKEVVEIGTDREHPKADDLIQAYLEKHFSIAVDGKKVKYDYLGKEMGEGRDIFEMYVFIEATNVKAFKEMTVSNSILIEEHSSQLNFAACLTDEGVKKVVSRKGRVPQKVKW
jgi:hypothetical protein